MTWKVPLFSLALGDAEKEAVLEVLNSNWLTMGPRIEAFEAKFQIAIGGDVNAVAVSSCTAALHLATVALDIRPSDEVILPSLTFVATANAVRYRGATPVFADITSDADWTICPKDIERRISNKTKAIIVVHYAGYPCKMDEICDIAHRHGIAVIEDSAHALVSWDGDQALGTIGDIGCFSFFSNKNMTTGEGGMIVCRNPDVASRLRVLRSHGITRSTYDRYRGHEFGYDVVDLGYNYRIDEIRAAIGIVQLSRLEEMNDRRRQLVRLYCRLLLKHAPGVGIPFQGQMNSAKVAPHILPVLIPSDGPPRQAVQEGMAKAGIQTTVHYRPIHTFESYRNINAEVPNTDRIADRILTLPLFPAMTDDDVASVCRALGAILAARENAQCHPISPSV